VSSRADRVAVVVYRGAVAAVGLLRRVKWSLRRARGSVVGSAWYRAAQVGARRRALALRRRLDPASWSDADPYALLEVDPRSIASKLWDFEHTAPSLRYDMSYLHRLQNVNRVAGGDWDLRTNPFSDNLTYRIIAEHFGQGVPWRETEAFGIYLAIIRSGLPVWHQSRSEANLLARCARMEALCESMRRSGYEPRPLHAFDEITVNIGRDGELIYNSDGAHRLSLSKVVGVPTVKVRVLVRHAAWQAIRDEVARLAAADRPGELGPRARTHLRHPDLADLVPIAWHAEPGTPEAAPAAEPSPPRAVPAAGPWPSAGAGAADVDHEGQPGEARSADGRLAR
jgi:hypothetical protein